MVENVFEMGPDKALDDMTDGWNPWISHTQADVSPHGKELPKLIQDWCKERDILNVIMSYEIIPTNESDARLFDNKESPKL